jgi:molecular chaperone DnaK (HSP70)
MGRSKADAAADLPYLPYHVVEGAHNTARVRSRVGAEPYIASPQEVSAAILRALKEQAAAALGH